MAQLLEIQMDDRIIYLAIVGRMDIGGLHAIDAKFHAMTAGRRKPSLVDLSKLEFISSLGMGMIVSCARSLSRYGAKMVLLSPLPEVEDALKAVGIDQGIPIVKTVEDGQRILFPAS